MRRQWRLDEQCAGSLPRIQLYSNTPLRKSLCSMRIQAIIHRLLVTKLPQQQQRFIVNSYCNSNSNSGRQVK
jgi:hypothetical protein